MQMPGQFGQHDFERRAHVGLNQVSSMRRSVSLSDYDVRMEFLHISIERNVAEKREYLDLLLNRHVAIFLRLPIEESDNHARERTDGAEPACFEALLQCELPKRPHHLIVS